MNLPIFVSVIFIPIHMGDENIFLIEANHNTHPVITVVFVL